MSDRFRPTCRLALALLVSLGVLAPRAHAQVAETSITLHWTAPGDDSLTGRATRYDLRWALAPINTAQAFNAATPVSGLALPQDAGAAEATLVGGLTPETTYWFALRTYDEAGNVSILSNAASATTLASTDVLRPAPVPLSVAGTTTSSVTLAWTDSGDDSLSGNASATELRWFTAPITENNWAQATVIFGVPTPGAPGTAHTLPVNGLDRTRDLWFAARARDDVNRTSAVSAPLQVPHLLDTAPPAAPSGLSAAAVPSSGVRVQWAANAEADLAGYHVYRAPSASAVYTRVNAALVPSNQYIDASAPDSVSLWYAVSAVDATGNESARSAAFRVFLHGGDIAAWNVAAPYPNPSPAGSSVTLPLDVPAAGPYDATIEIQDAAGQHVRTLRVSGATPGPLALTWDGRNDAGRATAPGLYRVWLRAGDRHVMTRIVRVP
ncbi:MAG: FlgD immunoglobulin-like domain containing protein [Candidatus Eisenbacteria bacterium]